jgi:ApbE superfamily uncharacterized protein (UPF0280 family)
MRSFEFFNHKEANFRLHSDSNQVLKREIVRQRAILDAYISEHPEFRASLVPVEILEDAPEIVKRMHHASLLTGVGPMAAVAGTFSQLACEAALGSSKEAIVENGGDIFLCCAEEICIGLWAGSRPLLSKLAFSLPSTMTPLAICSSSSNMGHSLSLGSCDLGTVVAKDASLADACATLLCNLVKTPHDLHSALESIVCIPGVIGALAVKDEQVGLIGELPPLVKHDDPMLVSKITKAKGVDKER